MTHMKDDALKLAQRLCEEALPKFDWGASALDANALTLLNTLPSAIKKALAQPEQEPIGYWPEQRAGEYHSHDSVTAYRTPKAGWIPVYTTPPAQPAQAEPNRRDFENWLRSKWTAGYACKKLEGRYTDKAAQSFWECWQAAHGIK